MIPKVKIRDGSFLPFGGKSCSFYGARSKEAPVNFEWDNSDPGPSDVCFFTDTYIPRANDYKCKMKIALPLESPPFRQNTYDWLEKHEKDFDAIFTFVFNYRDRGGNKWIWRPHLGSMILPGDMRLYPKTKCCSMIYSAKTETPNHLFRQMIAPIAKDNGVDLLGDGVGVPVDKLAGLKDYSYSIVIEASSEPGCVTEQLFDCLAVGTIPIYFGPGFVSTPGDWVRRFFNREVLVEILHSINGKVVQTADTPSVQLAQDFSSHLPCVEDWLWVNWRHLWVD
jgi:hypothetical protein